MLPFSTSHWQVTRGNKCVSGNSGLATGESFTITLQTSDGTFTETVESRTDRSGFFNVCFTQPIGPGDRLSLTHSRGLMTFTVPNLTAGHDYARQVVEGYALPNSNIAVTLPTSPYYWYQAVRHTQADASGHYGIDTSDLSLPLGQSGHAVMTDDAGNTTQANFIIQGYRSYLPWIACQR